MIYSCLFRSIYSLPCITFSLYNNSWQKRNPRTTHSPQQGNGKAAGRTGKGKRGAWLGSACSPKHTLMKQELYTQKGVLQSCVLKLHSRLSWLLQRERQILARIWMADLAEPSNPLARLPAFREALPENPLVAATESFPNPCTCCIKTQSKDVQSVPKASAWLQTAHVHRHSHPEALTSWPRTGCSSNTLQAQAFLLALRRRNSHLPSC